MIHLMSHRICKRDRGCDLFESLGHTRADGGILTSPGHGKPFQLPTGPFWEGPKGPQGPLSW